MSKGTNVRVRDIFGEYVSNNDKSYTSTKNISLINHSNNWQKQAITEEQYIMG